MNHTLTGVAFYADIHGIHTGNQFATAGPLGPCLDICAIAYMQAEGGTVPPEFYTDEDASLRLIESSPKAMAAIKAISDVLDTTVCETEVAPGYYVPDYIEHVSNWVATAPPVGPKRPPTVSEVIGRIRRAANHPATHAA
ncbi:hypothetical protein ACFV0T_26515 [Streptomyces sp. NPDC059582]|uniref:hypothetical protein n=1 Tax=Streptomyces sp. NPDC059582 TaxID=3346875 RepID=UPI00369D739A